MTDFLACINNAVTNGKLSEKKAKIAAQVFASQEKIAIDNGMAGDAAKDVAALASVKAITDITAPKRWERVNELRKANTLFNEIMSSDAPWDYFDNLMNNMDIAFNDRLQGIPHRLLEDLIVKYSPKYGGLSHPIDGMDELVDAGYGQARTPEAEAYGKAMREALDLSVDMANAHGASIPKSDKFNLPQSHDRLRVQSAGREVWVNEHLKDGVLDWEVMRYAGLKIPEDQRATVLGKVWDAIVTDGGSNTVAGQAANKSMAANLSDRRFLYYATPEAWREMQGKYGTGNVIHQLFEQIRSLALATSVMEKLGPNPTVMLEFAKRTAEKRTADLILADPKNTKGLRQKFDEGVSRLQRMYDIHTLNIDTGAGNWMAMTMGDIRTTVAANLLTGVFISSLSDVGASRWAKYFAGLPQSGVISAYAKAFFSGERTARQLIRDGVVWEAGLSMHHLGHRYYGQQEGRNWSRGLSDFVYRAGLAHHWNTVGKKVGAANVAGALADFAGKSFEEIPFVNVLDKLGITEKDWDLVKNTPLHMVNGADFLRPIDMWTNATSQEAKEAAEKFMDLQSLMIRKGVPQSMLRTRLFMASDLPASSIMGQVVRTEGMFMSFVSTVFFDHWRSIAELPTRGDRLKAASVYFINTTVAGAVITQLKALINGEEGYNLEQMATVDFLTRSVLNGGSAGIFGDFVADNLGLSNSTAAYGNETPLEAQWRRFQAFSSSAAKTGANALGVEIENYHKVNLSKDALNLAQGLIPKLWWYKLVFNRTVGDELLKSADPAAYRKKIKAEQLRERETGRGMWWGTGE